MEATNGTTNPTSAAGDAWLFGWDEMPGIVSVWADRSGRALVWQRTQHGVKCHEDRFRPWLYAASLQDLQHLGGALIEITDESSTAARNAPFTYRKLDGDDKTLCYLVSARDGRALQQAVLTGVSTRTGQPAEKLRDLPDYYSVGPVEQYLMLSGRVYFRGLTYPDLHRLQFDLETTGLSPQDSRIFMVAVRDSHGLAQIIEAPTPADEARLITDLCNLIQERDPDIIENHNLFGFDLPFLEQRAAKLGVSLRLGRKDGPQLLESYDEAGGWHRSRRNRYSLAGRELVDTLDAVRRHDFVARDMTGHGLKAAARYFGLAPTDRTYIAGPEIYKTYQTDPETVRRYAFDDVTEVDGLSQHLMGATFALAGMAPRRYERLASAGPATGILEPMLVRAYFKAQTALPRNAAAAEAQMPPHQGGATILYAAGVARSVVKADIASMYPSIMRIFGIGPSCDPLKVLLYLVDRLTDLRLQHKDAAKAVATDPIAARSHNAVQAAMKLIVNSAYGYMGAGQMALFADRAAADAVTRRGREILSQVVERLREHGMVLLEADTDGVFFAVPEGWTEQHERDCVAEVAATLPVGLRLEYEGRYKAMLSHEVKNYALLTYNDELIVRGGALHSSRSEPFGENFLKSALHCTLLGDIVGLRDTFLDTVTALRERRLSLKEVSTVFKTSKTFDEYNQSRRRKREAAYEALLAAGRTHWRIGEKVRFYRGERGANIWLPEAHNDTSRVDEARQDELPSIEATLPGYDIEYYLNLLQNTYVSRLRKAFAPSDFEQLFRTSLQTGLFDQPLSQLQPLWIR